MNLVEEFEVKNVKKLPYRGIDGLELESSSGTCMYLEYPSSIIKIPITVGNKVKISLSKVKDENYKVNWDIYMWGLVYYVSERFVRISIGGLILELKNVDTSLEVGDRVYIGIKKLS
ncbi:MAG: hypothetical protein B6V02_00295 [Thermoprotei archaeon ex4572_64]|nr:MAG: hypothetical protein B6V02_00295 [Thermoprotei archaeon ex4572_64]